MCSSTKGPFLHLERSIFLVIAQNTHGQRRVGLDFPMILQILEPTIARLTFLSQVHNLQEIMSNTQNTALDEWVNDRN